MLQIPVNINIGSFSTGRYATPFVRIQDTNLVNGTLPTVTFDVDISPFVSQLNTSFTSLQTLNDAVSQLPMSPDYVPDQIISAFQKFAELTDFISHAPEYFALSNLTLGGTYPSFQTALYKVLKTRKIPTACAQYKNLAANLTTCVPAIVSLLDLQSTANYTISQSFGDFPTFDTLMQALLGQTTFNANDIFPMNKPTLRGLFNYLSRRSASASYTRQQLSEPEPSNQVTVITLGKDASRGHPSKGFHLQSSGPSISADCMRLPNDPVLFFVPVCSSDHNLYGCIRPALCFTLSLQRCFLSLQRSLPAST